MSFGRMLCSLIIWMDLNDCSPCCAQPSRSADLLPSAELNTQTQAAESKPDPAAQKRIRIAEARRLWEVVLVNRRAGKSQEARGSYVLYLKAAYVANANPWLLLELGRTLEQLGQTEQALTAYKNYLTNAPAQKDQPADQEEAEQAVHRLEGPRSPYRPVQQENDHELPGGSSRFHAPSHAELNGLAPDSSPRSAEAKPRFSGEIALGANYRWNATDPVVGGHVQLVLGAQFRLAQVGAVLRLEVGGTLTGLPLLMPGLGLTILFPIHRRVRVGSTESLGLLAVQRVSASEGSPLVSYLLEVSADLKVDLYVRPSGASLYLHVSPGYEYFGLVGSGFVGRFAIGYRFGRSP